VNGNRDWTEHQTDDEGTQEDNERRGIGSISWVGSFRNRGGSRLAHVYTDPPGGLGLFRRIGG
jgi:hypothetical protein